MVDRLPNEIWMECFQYLGPAETAEEEIESKRLRLERDTSRYLWVSQYYASHVRTLNFEYSYRRPTRATPGREDLIAEICKVYSQFKRTFLMQLPAFTNLRTVTLKFNDASNSFPKHMLERLAKHPMIEELCIKGGSFGFNALATLLKLKRFTLDNREREGKESNRNTNSMRLSILTGEELLNLCLISKAYSFKIIRSLTALQPDKRCAKLNSLVLDYVATAELEGLFLFLDSCPNLRHLAIRQICCYQAATFADKMSNLSVIPLLNSFCGPRGLAVIVVPGRPVETVQIVAEPECHAPGVGFLVESGLSLSTGPVQSLEMSCLLSPQVMRAMSGLTNLVELSLELGMRGTIPDRNTFCYLSVGSVATGDFNIAQGVVVQGSLIQIDDMEVLHGIAANGIELPRNLRRLHLHGRYIPRMPMSGSCAFPEATHMLEAVSRLYPAFCEVRTSYSGVFKVCWLKDCDGVWFYNTALL